MQLAAGQGKQHGPGASRLPPYASRQRGVHRGLGRARRMGLDGDPGGHGVHRHAAARRPRLGARRRFHPAQHPPVSAECRPDGAAQQHQPAGRDDLGGAARRHPHDADRLSTERPRAAKCGAAPASARTRAGPTRNGSASPATTTPRSASMAASPATGWSISPRPTAASRCCATWSGAASAPSRAATTRPALHNGKAIATYGHDRVVSGIPPAATPEEDRRLLREVARDVVTEMIGSAAAHA